MELSGGEVAAAADPFDEDRLSALHDDVLVHILLLLDNAAAAGRTSVLSRRWRGLWALLPELRFPVDSDLLLVASALAAHEGVLRCIHVGTLDAAPESVEAWLAVAADRLSGGLVFQNQVPGANAGGDGDEGAGERGAFQLPCFANATAVSLDLAVPTAGVFGRLTDLSLSCVRFQNPCELGDAVSSLRCPGLQKLGVSEASGLASLAIHSESLLELYLNSLDGLQQLTVVALALALKMFSLFKCFVHSWPIANISTTQLVGLEWLDVYDPTSVKLGNLAHFQQLTSIIHVYGLLFNSWVSNGFLQLLDQFQAIQDLTLLLIYPKSIGIGISQYVLGNLTKLPSLTFLTILLRHNGHSFGAALFHVLRMCRDLRTLTLLLHNCSDLEVSYMCPSGCVCDQPTDWKTEELTLNCLQEVAIDMEVSDDRQVAFVKRLFTWAVMLKTIEITFNPSISESEVMELRQTLLSFSRPGTRVEFYVHDNAGFRSRL